MRLVMQRQYVIASRLPLAGEQRVRAQCHPRHAQPAGRIALESPLRVVVVLFDNESSARRKRQEEEHVAARKGGNERLLGIHRERRRIRQRHHVRRARCWNHRTSIESPLVRSAVSVVDECRALPAPRNGCGVRGHFLCGRRAAIIPGVRLEYGATLRCCPDGGSSGAGEVRMKGNQLDMFGVGPVMPDG